MHPAYYADPYSLLYLGMTYLLGHVMPGVHMLFL